MEISAGIICMRLNENQETEFLVCTPGGPEWKNRECWNFPKGHIEEGETAVEAAVREFSEETGVELDNKLPLGYLGSVKQNSKKRVEVFIRPFGEEYLNDISKMHSNMFTSTDGNEYPEIGKYAWMTFKELTQHTFSKAYASLYEALSELNNDNQEPMDKWKKDHGDNISWINFN